MAKLDAWCDFSTHQKSSLAPAHAADGQHGSLACVQEVSLVAHLYWQRDVGRNVDAWRDDIRTDLGLCDRIAAARLGGGRHVEQSLEAEGNAQAVDTQQLQPAT